MLIEYIERLRKEPKEVRERAVAVWTAVLVGIIFLVYVSIRLGGTLIPDPEPQNTLAAPYESR